MAVFLSELLILKAGLSQGHYLAVALLAAFIVIAFFGVMAHLNRMVFGTSSNGTSDRDDLRTHAGGTSSLPLSSRLALILAAVPVLLFGVYIPRPLHDLLTMAAAALSR